MPAEVHAAVAGSGSDDILARFARWLFSKVWFGSILSAIAAWGNHFGWPQAVQTAAAVFGAVALAVTAWWLPYWTRQQTDHWPAIGRLVKLAVWLAVASCAGSLLISHPAVGCLATALLLRAAGDAFGHRLDPIWRRMRYQNPEPRTVH